MTNLNITYESNPPPMKTSTIIAILIIPMLSSCMNNLVKVSITKKISIQLPESYMTIEDDINRKALEARFNDDNIKVFRNSIDEPDSLSFDIKMKLFKKNINSFILSFDFKNLDSIYSYQADFMQSDLKFDFVSHNEPNKLFCRFIVQDKNFVGICYQTTDPADKNSIETKDEIFTSIKIK